MDNSVKSPIQHKKISLLATGNEIIHGDIKESNAYNFAKTISSIGGNIYQHLYSSDGITEIASGLKYLLDNSDAVIITGGLGPTSDDRTRYALAKVLQQDLEFSEIAWEHIEKRFARFNLTISESNRSQALFPKSAELYPNEHGTAFGCYVQWQNKNIFMLPGPPKESWPMFENHVISRLAQLHFFVGKNIYRWLTLGLVEGEIATKVDTIVEPYKLEAGYRWNYPYLEIKLITDGVNKYSALIRELETLLKSNIVSTDGKDAIETLKLALDNFNVNVNILDYVTEGLLEKTVTHKNLNFYKKERAHNSSNLLFEIKASHSLYNLPMSIGTVALSCFGYVGDELKYQHKINTPNHGVEVLEYAKAYSCWQMRRFLNVL